MIAFEIELNGQSLGRTGAEDLSVLSAIISAVGRLGTESRGASNYENNYHVEITVGGLTARGENIPDKHLDWIEHDLKPGDVIIVRIVETSSTDLPKSSQPARTKDDLREQFEWAKNFYLEHRDKFDGS